MTATITNMDYRMVDVLNASQLEIDDLIGLGDEVIRITAIDSTKNGFVVTYENEFGEKDMIEIDDDSQFDLYILD